MWHGCWQFREGFSCLDCINEETSSLEKGLCVSFQWKQISFIMEQNSFIKQCFFKCEAKRINYTSENFLTRTVILGQSSKCAVLRQISSTAPVVFSFAWRLLARWAEIFPPWIKTAVLKVHKAKNWKGKKKTMDIWLDLRYSWIDFSNGIQKLSHHRWRWVTIRLGDGNNVNWNIFKSVSTAPIYKSLGFK